MDQQLNGPMITCKASTIGNETMVEMNLAKNGHIDLDKYNCIVAKCLSGTSYYYR